MSKQSFPVLMPPPSFFRNDLWRRKLVKLGATYAQSAELATEIARETYLMPADMAAMYLRSCIYELTHETET